MEEVLVKPDGSRLPLVVAHTHGHHGSHSNAAFAAQPKLTVVPVDSEGMRKFFGLQNWPEGGAHFELGNRRSKSLQRRDIIPITSVFIDSRTRLLQDGDFLLPGRLLVDDIEASKQYHAGHRSREYPWCWIRSRRSHRDGGQRRAVFRWHDVGPARVAAVIRFRRRGVAPGAGDFNGFSRGIPTMPW